MDFRSEKLLQLVGCEEGWFESSDKLISHGINVGDVKKFQEAGSPLILVRRNETSPLYALLTLNNGIIQDLTRSSIDLSDLLHLPTSYRDYMMKAEAGDGFFLSPPLIRWENIKKKFFVDRIPPSWTPNLLLVHPNRNTCQLFDPEQYKALANIKQKTITELRESATCEEMFEELKELKELTFDDYQELATYEIEHDLRGFKLIGSFPNGWLILVNYAKQSFHLYEMSGSKWQTLMVYPGLTPNKNFIGVCDGMEIILLLEMSEGETVIHIFQIQGFDIVVHHQKFLTELKGNIKNALLCKNQLYVVVSNLSSMRLDCVGGKVIPRTTDLTIKALELQETWFTSMVLSPVNTPLLIVFPPEMQFTVFEVYGEGVNLDMQKVTYIHLPNLQLYLAPNGGGCTLQEEHTVCLSTHVGADCLRGTTELHHDYEEDDYESDGEAPDEADEEASDEADEEAPDETDEKAPDEADEEAPDEADEEAPDEADEKAPDGADEEAPDEADEEASDEEVPDEADEKVPDEADEDVPAQAAEYEADEDLLDQAADEMEDDDYFTIWQRIRECPWDSQWEVCPCQPVWVMLPPIDMKKFLAVPSYIG
uniref:Signal recognition particle GTPase, FtsY n=1 Tax=Solanum tuberosum TaxID=4113 RepID=M1BIM1_SOLTU